MQAQAVSYLCGPWVLLVGRDAVVLADLDPAGPAFVALWQVIEGGAGVDAVLGAIMREGLRSVPSFAISDGARVLISGKARAEVTVHLGQAPHVLSAAEAATWLDRRFEQAETIRLFAEGVSADGPAFPLRFGATLAAAALLGELQDGAAPSRLGPEAAAIGSAATAGGLSVNSDAVDEATPAQATPAEATPAEATPAAATPAEPGPEVQPAQPEPSAEPVEPMEAETPKPSFDHLFGATENRPDVAENQPEATEARSDAAEARSDAPMTVEAAAATIYPPPHDDAEPKAAGPGLIERLPWELPAELDAGRSHGPRPPARVEDIAPAESTTPPYVVSDASQSDAARSDPGESHTVARSRLRPPEDVPAPSVLASVCPNRHVGPPHAAVCRVCGQPVPQQDPIRVPRPVLGVIILPTGDMVPLDRDIVLGRAPSASETDPSARPHLVQLASEAHDISRSHLRISIEGWHVQAIDLGSTNGTIVTPPGQQPVRLRAHDPFTVVPGTTLNLADEVLLRYEVST